MIGTLYVITNRVNGMQYVGKTYKTVEERFQEHIRDSRRKRNENRKLYQAMNEFGVDNFYILEIGQYEESELEQKEIEYIYFYNTYRNGYNQTLGGDGKRYIDTPDEEFVRLYHELGAVKAVSRYTGHDSKWISRILKRNGVVIKGNNSTKSIQIEETGDVFGSVIECANYLIENKMTKSNNPVQVTKYISRALTGKRGTYLNMTFKYV